jgi:hypothetical protein
MTVQTFGVTETLVEAHLPMILIDSGAGTLLTSARLTILLNSAAARVNALIDGAFGEGSSTSISSDATSIEYNNAQRLVLAALLPDVLRAAHHPPAIGGDISGLIEDYDAQIQMLISDPARALGLVNDPTSVSALRSRFISLGLSTTTTAQRARREFDGRSNLLGVDEGGFQF